VVLVHGLGGSVENWAPNIGPLSACHRVYAMDLPGFGRTDKTPLISSIYDLAYFIADFMEVLQIEKASLVGNSLGGGLVLQVALQHPEKLEKLVLVDNAGIGREVIIDFRLCSIPLLGELLTRPSRNSTASLWEKIVYDPSIITDDMVTLGYELITLPGAQKALLTTLRAGIDIWGQRSSLTKALLTDISTITAPSLVVWGKQDRILPLAHAYKCHEYLPGSELYIFDNCGHMPQLEHPDEFNELVLRFLDGQAEQPW
ncbi:MAG: alpha/beta fold hydrolase, partial [Dehalococcoidales bacterium]|nr:alpha/beta fold hydrolase [Dehalococcoidales bacterium]